MKTLEQRIADIKNAGSGNATEDYYFEYKDSNGDYVNTTIGNIIVDHFEIIQELQQKLDSLQSCYDITNQSWRELVEENQKLKQQLDSKK